MGNQHYTMIQMEQEAFINWDFKKADTKELTHGLHTYPAMMIPQIARRLIYLYGNKAKTLLDPFMGSGTSLVEASLTPHIEEAYGFDLNPLAFLISKVKTTPINAKVLDEELSKIINSEEHNAIPKFKNIEFWFKPKVIEQLATIKTAINEIKDKKFCILVFFKNLRNIKPFEINKSGYGNRVAWIVIDDISKIKI